MKEKNIVINGVRLYSNYNITNTELPTLIFLHDSLGCIQLWRSFPKELAQLTNCNYLIYDRQGYGKSDPFSSNYREHDYLEQEAVVLKEIINSEQIQKPILFGHSDGGSIALLAAAKYPSLIHAIITEGAHVFVEDITLDGIKAVVKQFTTTNLKERLARYHDTKTEAVFKMWADTWLRPDFKNWNIESFLPQIKCSNLIIQGDDDEFGSVDQVDAIIQQTEGNSIKRMIANQGHTPHKTAKEEILNITSSFITNL